MNEAFGGKDYQRLILKSIESENVYIVNQLSGGLRSLAMIIKITGRICERRLDRHVYVIGLATSHTLLKLYWKLLVVVSTLFMCEIIHI